MSTPVVSVDDFALYLNNRDLDEDRAAYILAKAQVLCESVITPLPTGSDTVILDVAERAFANPTGVANTNLALYAEGEGPFSDGTPGTTGGGLWLTRDNKATLRRLAGGGGAFSMNLLAGYTTPDLPWYDANAADPLVEG